MTQDSAASGGQGAQEILEKANRAIMVSRSAPDQGLIIAESALTEARALGVPSVISRSWYALCVSLLLSGRYSEALRKIHEAKRELMAFGGGDCLPVELLNVQGAAYRHLGFYNVAIDSFFEAERGLKETTEDGIKSSLYNNLGLAYCEIGMHDHGIEYLLKAGSFREPGDFRRIMCDSNVGYALNEAKRFDEALEILDTSLAAAEKLGNLVLRSSIQDNRGVALAGLGRAAEADKAFQDAVSLVRNHGTPKNLAETYVHYADFLMDEGRSEEAEAICAKAHASLHGHDERILKCKLLAVQARCLEGMERWKEASLVRREYMGINPDKNISTGREFVLDRQLSTERSEVIDLEFSLRQRAEELVEAQSILIESLATVIEARNEDTGTHVKRTCRYVSMLAGELLRIEAEGISEEMADTYGKVAALHDIGKVGISDSILLKEGIYTNEEREIMKRHVAIGSGILGKILWLSSDSLLAVAAREVIGSHHERWDGSGYPLGLKGRAIPMGGRIMAVADVYDALRSERPYKEARTHEYAREFIRENAQSLFDPDVVEAFMMLEAKFAAVFEES